MASEDHNAIRIFDLELDVPKLSDLCRNVIRKCIAHQLGGVDQLPVPQTIKNFVNYDLEKLQSHYRVET